MAAEEQDSDAPDLRLRATPRPVTRLKGALVLMLAAMLAFGLILLITHGFSHGKEELTAPDKPGAVAPHTLPWVLAALPKSYDQIRHVLTHLTRSLAPEEKSPTRAPARMSFAAPRSAIPALSPGARSRAHEALRAAHAGVFFDGIAAAKTPQASGSAPHHPRFGWRRHDASHYALLAGAIIPASLITGLKSDLSGPVLAQISENVYDSITGSHLLLPQGARLIGSYDNHIAYGQSRVRVVFSRIILPNGTSLALGHLPASDEAGYVGLTGGVDDHLFMLLKGASVSSLLGIAAEQGLGLGNSVLAQALRQSVISSANQGGEELVHKSINVAPTITVPPGTPFTVVVQKTLMLPAFRGEPSSASQMVRDAVSAGRQRRAKAHTALSFVRPEPR